MSKLTERDRVRIADLCRTLRLKWTEVARQMKRKFRLEFSPRTCQRTWAKWRKCGQLADLNRSGRPNSCTTAQRRRLCDFAKQNRFSNLKEIQEFAQVEMGATLSRTTVGRVLKNKGLFRRIALRKPLLTNQAREKRLAWAKKYRWWRLPKWKKIVFSDEKIFRGNNNMKKVFVTRGVSEKYKKECIFPTVKNAAQAHFWGIVGWKGQGPLKLVEGNLNACKYQTDIINDVGEICRSLVPGAVGFVFQHDMPPAHNAASTREFLRQRKVPVLEWPGNSPDMNILENMWAETARRVGMDRTLPRNRDELILRVQNAWGSIPVSYIHQLYKSIPKRINALLVAEGGTTPY